MWHKLWDWLRQVWLSGVLGRDDKAAGAPQRGARWPYDTHFPPPPLTGPPHHVEWRT